MTGTGPWHLFLPSLVPTDNSHEPRRHRGRVARSLEGLRAWDLFTGSSGPSALMTPHQHLNPEMPDDLKQSIGLGDVKKICFLKVALPVYHGRPANSREGQAVPSLEAIQGKAGMLENSQT